MLVVGIDVALVNTGVAAIEDGRATKWCTINVEGSPDDTGPRFVKLRESLSLVAVRILKKAPDLVVIERPEHGIRDDRDAGNIMKLYGSFAVAYAETVRLWPRAEIMGVEPMSWKGTLGKGMTARLMQLRYKIDCANDHEWDAVGLADYGWELAAARARAGKRNLDRARSR